MSTNLIGEDIVLMRNRYDEALKMRGIGCKYQFPNLPDSNRQGEALVDSYSEMIATYVFFDGNPKVKTYKRYGWVVLVENVSRLVRAWQLREGKEACSPSQSLA